MTSYVITENPSDHPGLFVCRMHIDGRPTETHWFAKELERVEALVPAGYVEGPLLKADDPVIRKWFVSKEHLALAERFADRRGERRS